MDIKKEYLDLNDNYSYHKASAADWRGIGYMEIPLGADIYFMEWFYKEIQEGKWLVWDRHKESWKPCDFNFREDCPNIHWKRDGVTLKKAVDRSISNQVIPGGYVLVPRELSDEKADIQASLAWSCHLGLFKSQNRDMSNTEIEEFRLKWCRNKARDLQEEYKAMIEAQEQSHD